MVDEEKLIDDQVINSLMDMLVSPDSSNRVFAAGIMDTVFEENKEVGDMIEGFAEHWKRDAKKSKNALDVVLFEGPLPNIHHSKVNQDYIKICMLHTAAGLGEAGTDYINVNFKNKK
jgi:hypothetical protein